MLQIISVADLPRETRQGVWGVTREDFVEQVTLHITAQRQTRLCVGKMTFLVFFQSLNYADCWLTSCGFCLIQSQTLITGPGVPTKSYLFFPRSIPGCAAWQRSAGKEGEDWLILSASFMKRVFPKMQAWFYILRKCLLKTELSFSLILKFCDS